MLHSLNIQLIVTCKPNKSEHWMMAANYYPDITIIVHNHHSVLPLIGFICHCSFAGSTDLLKTFQRYPQGRPQNISSRSCAVWVVNKKLFSFNYKDHIIYFFHYEIDIIVTIKSR